MSNEYRRLFRSRDKRMIAGVCAGLGEYFGIDPTLVRLAFALSPFVIPGAGLAILLVYLLLLIVVPEEPVASAPPSPVEMVNSSGAVVDVSQPEL